MIWESIKSEHAESVFRSPIFGGWLVKIVQERARQIPMYEGEEISWRNEEGFEWQTSITFVPDVNHEWDLTKDFKPI